MRRRPTRRDVLAGAGAGLLLPGSAEALWSGARRAAILDKGGGGGVPMDVGSRVALIGNSWYGLANGRRYIDWFRPYSGNRFYSPSTAAMGLPGDRYTYTSALLPGYVSRVPNAMAMKPAAIALANAINDIEAYDLATTNANLDAVLAAIVAHENFPLLNRIILTTTPQYWRMTTATNAVRTGHNAYIRSIVASNRTLYALIDDDLYSMLGFGDYGDTLHSNANGAYKLGLYGGAAIGSLFATGDYYPPVGVSTTSATITGVSLAGPNIRFTKVGHGLTKGMPIKLLTLTGSTLSPAIAGNRYIVGDIIDADTFELMNIPSSGFTGGATGGTYSSGMRIAIGSNLWTLTNATGATVASALETVSSKDYLTATISGTATTASSIGFTFGANMPRGPGVIAEGFVYLGLTNAAGDGPPVGVAALAPTMGSASFLGSTVEAWTLTPGTPAAGNILTIDFYNANTVPPNTPVTTMITDAPGYDAGQYRIKSLEVTVPGSPTTTTTATAIKDAINADATLTAAGITATSSGAVVTVVQGSATRSGTYIAYTTNGATTLNIGANVPPVSVRLWDVPIRLEARTHTNLSATSTALNFYIIPFTGQTLDAKIWIRDPIYVPQEETAYAAPYAQALTSIHVVPTVSLAASVATGNVGQFSGGGLTYSYEWFVNVSATNPTGTNIPAVVNGTSSAPSASDWVTTGFTDNPHDFTGAGLSGRYLICRITATNSDGSAYQWTTRSAVLP